MRFVLVVLTLMLSWMPVVPAGAVQPLASAKCSSNTSIDAVAACLSSMREAYGRQPYLKTYPVTTCAQYNDAYSRARVISGVPAGTVSCTVMAQAVVKAIDRKLSWAACAGPLNETSAMVACLSTYAPRAGVTLPDTASCGATKALLATALEDAGGGPLPSFTCREYAAAIGMSSGGRPPAWGNCLAYDPAFAGGHARLCLAGTRATSCEALQTDYQQRVTDANDGILPDNFIAPPCADIDAVMYRPAPVQTAQTEGTTTRTRPQVYEAPAPSGVKIIGNMLPGLFIALVVGAVILVVFFVLKDSFRKPRRELERTEHPELSEAQIQTMSREKRGEVTYSGKAVLEQKEYVSGGEVMLTADFSFKISRNLAAMDHREREFWRIYQLMRLRGWLSSRADMRIQFGLIWGGGKATVVDYNYSISKGLERRRGLNTIQDAIHYYAKEIGVNTESAISELLNAFEKVQAQNPADETVLSIAASLTSGNRWFGEIDIPGSPFEDKGGPGLFLGLSQEDGRPFYFYGEGSLATIAPPGAGKTQSHIIPNLFMWRGPAVVLDIKGELWEKTSFYRQQLGPIYRFAPFEPERSHHYNPLSAIRTDPTFLWEDCVAAANLMVLPSGAKDPFWEQSAQKILAAFIAFICMNNPDPDARSVDQILDLASGVGLDRFLADAKYSEFKQLVRAASGIAQMSETTRAGVLSQLETSLQAWAGTRIEQATAYSDWVPGDIRDQNATVYICVRPDQIESVLSLLRVFIGQHIRQLTNVIPDQQKDVLFFLDEFPQLRRMSPVEEGIAVGRSYGVRLWLIAQSIAQVRTHYGQSGDGMIGQCAVRAFMNPSLQDGTAQKVSADIGTFESVIDGRRQPIAEPQELAGPEFANDVVAFAHAQKPIRLTKLIAEAREDFTHVIGEAAWPPNAATELPATYEAAKR